MAWPVRWLDRRLPRLRSIPTHSRGNETYCDPTPRGDVLQFLQGGTPGIRRGSKRVEEAHGAHLRVQEPLPSHRSSRPGERLTAAGLRLCFGLMLSAAHALLH